MGTVLSFSPRERRPIYSTQHGSFGGGSTGTISNSNSADFQLNNYSYEQMNNVKNRENTKPPNIQTVPNNNQHINNSNNNNLVANHHNNNGSLVLMNGQTHINNTNRENNINNNNGNNLQQQQHERSNDTARILSEKNALEKNLKKHSLFINALSWKRLAASHNKKKQLADNNKNKAANLPTATFRKLSLFSSPSKYSSMNIAESQKVFSNDIHINNNQKLQPILLPILSNSYTEGVHPSLVIDKNKNLQHNQNHVVIQDVGTTVVNTNGGQQTVYFTPNGPKTLLPLDLMRANNTAPLQQTDKIGAKIPLHLPLSLQSATQQQQGNLPGQQPQLVQHQHGHGPRKTVIQVSSNFRKL